MEIQFMGMSLSHHFLFQKKKKNRHWRIYKQNHIQLGTTKLLFLVFQYIWFSLLDFPSRSFLYCRGPSNLISSFNRTSSELILRGYFFSGLNHFLRYVCNILHIQIRYTPYLYPRFKFDALLNSFSNLNA